MLRHVVTVNFKAEVGQRERDEFAKKAAETLAQVPGTKNIIILITVKVVKEKYGYLTSLHSMVLNSSL